MFLYGFYNFFIALCLVLSSLSCMADDCLQTQVWESGRVYPAGSWVQRLGFRYQSRWWSINKNPEIYSGSLKVWLQQEKCGL